MSNSWPSEGGLDIDMRLAATSRRDEKDDDNETDDDFDDKDKQRRSRRRRSRSRSRRSRSRSRSSSPHRRRRSRWRSYSRSRSRSRSRERRRSRTPEYERHFRISRRDAPPNHTIVLKGLPPECDEDTIWTLINGHGFEAKDVRILRKRDTGQSRGFGFVEFQDVDTAKQWMEYNKNFLVVDDKHSAEMQYSVNNRPDSNSMSFTSGGAEQRFGDWICAKCAVNNFKKRDQCFKCGIRREESQALTDGGFSEIGMLPCDTILFRNLPSGCSDDKINSSLKRMSALEPLCITLSPSKQYAYIQMRSPSEAAQLLTTLTALTKLKIDGNEIMVSYSKLPLTAILTGANLTQNSADWKDQASVLQKHFDCQFSQTAPALAANKTQTDAANAAAAVAQTAIKKAQVMRQVTNQVLAEQVHAAQLAATMLVPGGTAALLLQQQHLLAVQEAAKAQLQATALARLGTVHTPYGELPRYPNPDTTQYQYEPKTGYYFDPSTGLYYDAESRYYYNGDTQQWLYWEGRYQTYLPLPAEGEKSSPSEQKEEIAAEPAVTEETEEKKKDSKTDKAKLAKQIQKDMERWAKQQNKGKQSTAPVPQTPETKPEVEEPKKKPKSADISFKILEKSKGKAGLVAYEGESDEDNPAPIRSATVLANTKRLEDKMTDLDKIACLLCRRQFPSKEVLVKHQQFSDLHKKNLESYRIEQNQLQPQEEMASYSPPVANSFQYRDRAKERRQKYGKETEEAPAPNKLKERYLETMNTQEQQTTASAPLGSDNVGNRLMKSMGWKEGQGLGRKNQGIVDPITQERRIQGAGLGSSGAVVKTASSATYKDNVRAALRDRFFEIDSSVNADDD